MTPRLSTARWTGVFYLGLALAGFVGFLFVRNELFVPDDAAATLANLVERAPLARLGVAADLTVVVAQALAAVWFFRLFGDGQRTAAVAIAAFGMVNAAAILVATAFSASAIAVAGDVGLAPGGDQAGTAQLLYHMSGTFWDVGGIFFGLWLIPMGVAVLGSAAMPRALGWVLVAGGVGYVIATYVNQLAPDAPGGIEAVMVGTATIGEFWMIGYLLFFGGRSSPR